MIEVFTTNVQEEGEAKLLVDELQKHFPQTRINIDMHDCDKVLRLEGKDVLTEKVMLLVEERGFACKVLE